MGVLLYNKLKLDKELARVLACHRLPITPHDGTLDVRLLCRAFEPHLAHPASRLSDPVFHVSLNPNPEDKVSDSQLVEMAHAYMESMGYGDQPYVVFLHEDIKRKHLHIVSSCIDGQGKTIDRFKWKTRSMEATKAIEQEFALIPTVPQQKSRTYETPRPVHYTSSDIKAQMASVVRHVIGRFRFSSRGELNTLLRLFNVSVEECRGQIAGREYEGIIYGVLDEKGQRVGKPIKASRIGQDVGYKALLKKYTQGKAWVKENRTALQPLRDVIMQAMNSSHTPEEFAAKIAPASLSVTFHRSEQADGRIYGVTFIDHRNDIVINGSRLDKAFAANRFEKLFNPDGQRQAEAIEKEPSHSIRHTHNIERSEDGILSDIFDTMLDAATEPDQWEEIQMKKRRKKKMRQ